MPGQWSAAIDQGSAAPFRLTIQPQDGSTFDPSPHAWEYVVHSPQGAAVFTLTAATTANGSVVADTGGITLTIAPAATAGLNPATYQHALWSDPGTTSALCWLSGGLVIQAVPQP